MAMARKHYTLGAMDLNVYAKGDRMTRAAQPMSTRRTSGHAIWVEWLVICRSCTDMKSGEIISLALPCFSFCPLTSSVATVEKQSRRARTCIWQNFSRSGTEDASHRLPFSCGSRPSSEICDDFISTSCPSEPYQGPNGLTDLK